MPYKNKEDARRQCREYYHRRKAEDPEYLRENGRKSNKKRRANPEAVAADNKKAKIHMAELRSDPVYLKRRNAQRRANYVLSREADPDQYEMQLAARRVESRQKNKERRAWVNSHKDCCRVCDEAATETLAFHHMDPSTKKFSLAISPASRSKAALIEEMNKCIVLCHNCHAKVKANTLDVSDMQIIKQTMKA